MPASFCQLEPGRENVRMCAGTLTLPHVTKFSAWSVQLWRPRADLASEYGLAMGHGRRTKHPRMTVDTVKPIERSCVCRIVSPKLLSSSTAK